MAQAGVTAELNWAVGVDGWGHKAVARATSPMSCRLSYPP